jgi:LysM repeat protein
MTTFGQDGAPLLQTFPLYYGSGGGYYVPADYGVGGGGAAVLPQPAWVPAPGAPVGPPYHHSGVSPYGAPLYPVSTTTPTGSINASYAQPLYPIGVGAVPATQAISARPDSSVVAAEGAKQRCRKCMAYFTLEENVEGVCAYHPGQYTTPEGAGPIMMPSSTLRRWSCCKSLEPDAAGCRRQSHTVDPTTAAILRRFDTSAWLREGLSASAGGGTLTQVSASSSSDDDDDDADKAELFGRLREEEEEHIRQGIKRMQLPSGNPDVSAHGGVVMVRHLVAKTDTLAGVSLRYGVKVDDIKQANNLTSQSIFAHKYLLVPNPARTPPPSDDLNSVMPKDGKKSIASERFRALAKCGREEAQFYLEEHDYDFKLALAAYQADLEWEKKAPKPHKVTTSKRY